eukprot:Blabericola_migrator_1__9130@NODE_4882_length_946_cov_178_401593_g3055_i0_p1_GENE_NODE_4882_length_946_cov_178_401593_g3055_i0NODE_4882_length_946_cov_178_401593_g3055_i0_p1_ORF_typecomplete_len263_score48_25zfCHY/PF05495_12/2_8e19zfCHY/PF05495_12/1_8e04zfRING_UBOX/PF13445_6/1e04zfRING_UBOX/PF13445_6/1_3e04zfRING_UBOX/PF13445_6/1_6e08zfRING_UBOX/PF13445_6/2_2e03zfRING_2/PF13639_6/1_8e04zfRING_2/PF13639_6/1_8e04zfRING_2/PF13639_6/1_8e04zfRING_2/PF13639_6/1_8e08zfC3HC4/PF00097_25/4_7e03zfC3HC4/PF0
MVLDVKHQAKPVRIRRNRAVAETEDVPIDVDKPGCKHYSRRCKLVCPQCDLVFPCRFCHDEVFDVITVTRDSNLITYEDKTYPAHKIDRQAVKELVCTDCDTKQPVSPTCTECNVIFGAYHCLVCNFFDDDLSKGIWHCDKCNLCRVGGQDKYYHCDNCDGCYPLALKDKHKCLFGAMHQNCPICLEAMFDSIKSVVVLEKCGHTIHQECFVKHRRSAYDNWDKCPLCLCVHTSHVQSPATTDEWHTEEELEDDVTANENAL